MVDLGELFSVPKKITGGELCTTRSPPVRPATASRFVATGKIGDGIWPAVERKYELAVCSCHSGWLLQSVPENGTWVWRHVRNDS